MSKMPAGRLDVPVDCVHALPAKFDSRLLDQGFLHPAMMARMKWQSERYVSIR